MLYFGKYTSSYEFAGIITATVKASENGFLELHIDRDQANAFLLTNGDEVEVLL